MNGSDPAVTVVAAPRTRRERLAALIDSLRAQTLAFDRFEVLVVDDGSTDSTAELLDREQGRPELALRGIRRDHPGGPGAARNEGWRQSKATLTAFIDDDCVATPGWLEAGLTAARSSQGAIVQGRTEADPIEEATAGPFSYTIRVPRLGPHYETCNI